jgi:hypothetical protein
MKLNNRWSLFILNNVYALKAMTGSVLVMSDISTLFLLLIVPSPLHSHLTCTPSCVIALTKRYISTQHLAGYTVRELD